MGFHLVLGVTKRKQRGGEAMIKPYLQQKSVVRPWVARRLADVEGYMPE